jgi:hypothetical protein
MRQNHVHAIQAKWITLRPALLLRHAIWDRLSLLLPLAFAFLERIEIVQQMVAHLF